VRSDQSTGRQLSVDVKLSADNDDDDSDIERMFPAPDEGGQLLFTRFCRRP